MRDAAANLVAAKYRIDSLLRSSDASLLNDALLTYRSMTMDPGAFVHACFPFLYQCRGAHPDISARMPIAQVIGESWRWGPVHAARGEDELAEAFLLSDDRASPKDPARAEYFWLREFGIWWGHEGKNRAQFLRLRGAQSMPAIVTPWGYPAANELRRFSVDILGRKEIWAVWQNRWVQRIGLPELSETLLTLYGVPAALPWPRNEPDPLVVTTAMHMNPHQNAVDLDPLRTKAKREREEVRVSIADLWEKGFARVDLRSLAKAGIAAVASIALFVLPFHLCKLAAEGAWCALGGFTLALGHRGFIIRRGRLGP